MLTPEELTELVREAVAEALAEASQEPRRTLLDRVELADTLKCSPGQVDKLRRAGMPCIYVGDSPRFEAEACLAWLRNQEKAS